MINVKHRTASPAISAQRVVATHRRGSYSLGRPLGWGSNFRGHRQFLQIRESAFARPYAELAKVSDPRLLCRYCSDGWQHRAGAVRLHKRRHLCSVGRGLLLQGYRDTAAIHAKLDEIIASMRETRNEVVGLEHELPERIAAEVERLE